MSLLSKLTDRIKIFVIVTLLVASSLNIITPQYASALTGSSFNSGRIIDDHIFFDPNNMTTQDIQAFLSSKVPICDTNHAPGYGYDPPFICLKDYSQSIPGVAADQYCSGAVSSGTKSAAQIIKDVSLACSISPKVLLVLLQKEQALITDTWPLPIQYTKATGYGCPDTSLPVNVDSNQNGCYDDYEGFFNQVWYAARQYQRYAKQPNSFGYHAAQNNYIQYNPNAGCSGTNVFIQNQATAGLYNYTPYQPNAAALNNLYGTGDGCSAYGNRNFWRLYSDWFGSPVSDVCYNGASGSAGNVLFHKYDTPVDNADFMIYSGSSTGCVESHIWYPGMGVWKSHIATIQQSIDYPYTQIVYGDLDGGGRDYPVIFGLQNTSTGKIESHVLGRNMKSFLAHAASNKETVNVAENNIRLADLNRDGKDEPILVVYNNSGSGMIELHAWGPGMQSWMYHVATNRASVDPNENIVEFGDLNGDGLDEAVLISVRNTGSGMVEFHVWDQWQRGWVAHIASNMPQLNTQPGSYVTFADLNGDGRDEAVLVATKATGSGKVEFHVWNPGFTSWQSHTASNQPATP